jgi:hypothetical protein
MYWKSLSKIFFLSFTLRQYKSFLTSYMKLHNRTRNEKTTFYAQNVHILIRRDYFFTKKITSFQCILSNLFTRKKNLLTQWSMRFNLKMRSPCLFLFCLNWWKIKITEVYFLLLVCHIVWRKYRDCLNLRSSCHRSELGFPSIYHAVEDYKKCRQSSVSPSLQFSNSGEAWASPSLMAPPPMQL